MFFVINCLSYEIRTNPKPCYIYCPKPTNNQRITMAIMLNVYIKWPIYKHLRYLICESVAFDLPTNNNIEPKFKVILFF